MALLGVPETAGREVGRRRGPKCDPSRVKTMS